MKKHLFTIPFLLIFLTLAGILSCGIPGAGLTEYLLGGYEGSRSTNGAIGMFTVGTDGLLSAASPSSVSAGTTVTHATATADGKYVYAANYGSGTLSQFSSSGGALTALTPATVTSTGGPYFIAITPANTFLFVTNNNANTIGQFQISSTGALTANTPATVSVATTPYGMGITPDGKFLYVCLVNGAVNQYSIGTSGLLTPLSSPSAVSDPGARFIAIDPTGKYAYVSNSTSNTIRQYSIGLDGKLVALAPNFVASGGTGPLAIAITSDSKFVYVVNSTSNNVGQFSVTSTTGALVPLSPSVVLTGNSPTALSVSSNGKYLYVANSQENTISQFSIGITGTLTPLSPATVNSPDTDPSTLTTVKLN